MSVVVVNRIHRGFYLDSVALMRHARAIAGMAGVEEAALMMATPANKEIMADAGLLSPAGEAAQGGDLIIGIRATAGDCADAALAAADRLLEARTTGGGDSAWRPRTIRGAVRVAPDANLALISVPGDFAAAEARKAIRRGLHVMIFSDHVPVADEVALKIEARDRGLLLMGPDCGTAILNGVPLAFANIVPRGGTGIIGASGTGIQEVSSLIARHGGGISHAIGVGGRDLGEAVGGITTLMAIDMLDADPATDHIVLLSKPAAPAVAARITARIGDSRKSFTVCLIGAGNFALPANANPATTLKAAAESALGGIRIGEDFSADPPPGELPASRREVRGLYSGGTLAAEAEVIFLHGGAAVAKRAHRMIDLGDDAHTSGRPHPMIDPAARDGPMRAALADPAVGVVLLDVVIGCGAHPDPAGHLAGLIADVPAADRPAIVASVTGTDEDPQVRSAQAEKLRAAGAIVAPSNADAAALALALIGTGG